MGSGLVHSDLSNLAYAEASHKFAELTNAACDAATNWLVTRLSPARMLPTTEDLSRVHFLICRNIYGSNMGPGKLRGELGSAIEKEELEVGRLWEGSWSGRVRPDVHGAYSVAAPAFGRAVEALDTEREQLSARAMTIYACHLMLIQPFAGANRRVVTVVAEAQACVLLGEERVRRGVTDPGRRQFVEAVIVARDFGDLGPACVALTGIRLLPAYAKLDLSIDPWPIIPTGHGGLARAGLYDVNPGGIIHDVTRASRPITITKMLPSGRSIAFSLPPDRVESSLLTNAYVSIEVDRYLQRLKGGEARLIVDIKRDASGRDVIVLAPSCAKELDEHEAYEKHIGMERDQWPEIER